MTNVIKAQGIKTNNKATAPKGAHYFASTPSTWRTGTNLEELLKLIKAERQPYMIFLVPTDEDSNYEIELYQPQVKGTVLIAGNQWADHFYS